LTRDTKNRTHTDAELGTPSQALRHGHFRVCRWSVSCGRHLAVGSHRGDPSPRHLLGASRRYTSFASPREVVALRTEEHTSELQSLTNLVCRLLLEKKNKL